MTTQNLNQSVMQAGSFSKAYLVSGNDSADLPTIADALYVYSAGTVSMILADDTSANGYGTQSVGTILRFRVKRVRSTGTTAGLLALQV